MSKKIKNNFDKFSQQHLLPLSFSEWVELYHLLSGQNKGLKDEITGSLKKALNLLDRLENQHFNKIQQDFLFEIENMVYLNYPFCIHRQDRTYLKEILLLPHTVTHLEGYLSLIAEELPGGNLITIPINEIVSFKKLNSSQIPKVTEYEIEEFVSAIRSMNDSETRLILKIQEAEFKNLIPEHHFLGRPCMLTNPNGDLIWAAYVEPCDSLFAWVFSLGKKVEILDPLKFKEDYISYCEEKLKKIA